MGCEMTKQLSVCTLFGWRLCHKYFGSSGSDLEGHLCVLCQKWNIKHQTVEQRLHHGGPEIAVRDRQEKVFSLIHYLLPSAIISNVKG